MEDLSPFHEGERYIQTLTGTREDIESTGKRVIRDFMPDQHRDFFMSKGAKPIILLGTLDASQRPWASVIIGNEFVTSPDSKTLEFRTRIVEDDPLRLNLKEDAFVGLLGIEFATRRRNRMNGRVSLLDGGFSIRVDQSFGNCPKYIQARHWNWRDLDGFLAGKHPTAIRSTVLNEEQQRLVSGADTLFLATSFLHPDSETRKNAVGCDVSHRGGEPGFVQVSSSTTLKWPDYLGNFLFNSLGNIQKNPKCGLLFIDFETGSTLQMTGKGKVLFDDTSAPGSQRMVLFEVEEVIHIKGALPLEWEFVEYSPYNPTSKVDTSNKLGSMGLEKLALKCVEVRQEAHNAKTYRFSGGVPIPHIAGQYATFEIEADGKKYIRTWTISSHPKGSNDSISITVKKKIGGVISNWLFDKMEQGKIVTLQGISGYFTLTDGTSPIPPKVLMIAGGVGITPMMSMLRWLSYKKEQADVILIYSVSKAEDRVFTQELEQIQKGNPSVRVVTTASQPDGEWQGMRGRVSKEMITSVVGDLKERVTFLCGPEMFMQTLEEVLHSLGLPSTNLKTEKFDF